MSRAACAQVWACAARTERGAASVPKTMAREPRTRAWGWLCSRRCGGKVQGPNHPPNYPHSLLNFQRSEGACSSGWRFEHYLFIFFLWAPAGLKRE